MQLGRVTSVKSRPLSVYEIGWSTASSATIYPIPKLIQWCGFDSRRQLGLLVQWRGGIIEECDHLGPELLGGKRVSLLGASASDSEGDG